MKTLTTLVISSALLLSSLSAAAEVTLKNEVFKVVNKKNEKGEIIEVWQQADNMLPGDMAGYKITFTNNGDQPAADIVINNAVPEHTTYKANSAQGDNTKIEFSVDGKSFASSDKLTVTKDGKKVNAKATEYKHLRWLLTNPLAAGSQGTVQYIVTIK